VKDVWTHVAKINRPFTVAEVANEKDIEHALLGETVHTPDKCALLTGL
jgi:hypothetical protein